MKIAPLLIGVLVIVVLVVGILPAVTSTIGRISINEAIALLSGQGYMVLGQGSEISGDLIPSANNTWDIGSTARQWKDMYVASGSLYIGGVKLTTSNDKLYLTTSVGGTSEVGAGTVSGNLTVGNLVPSANNTYSLGSTEQQWASLHIAGGTIHLGTVELTDSDGCLMTSEFHAEGRDSTAGYLKLRHGNTPSVHKEANHSILWVDSTEKLFLEKADGTDIEIPLTDSTRNKTTGWLTGGQITINAGNNTKIDITAGSVLVVTGTDTPTGKTISWENQVGLDPALATRSKWIGVRDNSGVAEFVYDTSFDAVERRTIAILGRIWDSAGSGPQITNVGDYERPAWGLLTAWQDFVLEYGSWSISGNVYSANGANLLLDKSAGKSFRYHAEDTVGQENVHTDAAQSPRSSYAYHLQGSSTTTSETDIDPDYYDNGSIKTALANNKWTVQEVWYFPVSGTCHVLYGQTVYNSKVDAIDGITTETKVRNAGILDGAILRAYLVLEQDCTDLTNSATAEIREAKAGAGGGASGALWTKSGTNLSPTTAGDDVLLNAGETLSIADMTTGSILFVGADGLLSQDNSNLFWNNVNKRLGVDTPTPDSPLHIKANTPGTVGSHPAGQLIIQDPDDTVYSNVVITAYESDGAGNPDQQLWYLGSSSGSNTDITFLNRRPASLTLGTNSISRLTIDYNGNVGIGTPDPKRQLDFDGANVRTQRYLDIDLNTNLGYNTFGAGTLEHTIGNSGYYNNAFGASALYSVTTGDSNMAFGSYSLYALTTGYGNVAIGASTARSVTTGFYNVAIGRLAMYPNMIGDYNTAIGTRSLYSLNPTVETEGRGNIAIGYKTGDNITTGSRNIIIGYDIDALSATGDDQLNIGNTIYGDLSSGNVGIGTTSPTSALQVVGLPVYANNAAAITGGLTAGAFYRTSGDPDSVCVVHQQEGTKGMIPEQTLQVLDAAVSQAPLNRVQHIQGQEAVQVSTALEAN